MIPKYVLLFFTYSIFGWIMEVILSIIQRKKLINRGFLIGPYCPIYGIGVILITIFLAKYKEDRIITFVMSILICGTLEYFTSYFMEKIFHARWWDYSNKKMNINGRICLIFCIVWGVLGIVFIKWLYPFIEYTFDRITFKTLAQVTTVLATVFMIFNISISSLAAQRQYARRNKVMAKNDIDVFLDKYYPDEFMNRVYANKIDK